MKKWIYIIVAVLLITTGIGVSYYYYVIDDHRQEQHKALAKAADEYDLTDVKDIEHYYGSFGSFQVIHSEIGGEGKYVFVPIKKGEERIIEADKGWSKEQVKRYVEKEIRPERLISIHLGLEKFTKDANFIPVWEIVYKGEGNAYTFHYIRFSDGSFFKEYRMNQST